VEEHTHLPLGDEGQDPGFSAKEKLRFYVYYTNLGVFSLSLSLSLSIYIYIYKMFKL
jgi:hypothetical protein